MQQYTFPVRCMVHVTIKQNVINQCMYMYTQHVPCMRKGYHSPFTHAYAIHRCTRVIQERVQACNLRIAFASVLQDSITHRNTKESQNTLHAILQDLVMYTGSMRMIRKFKSSVCITKTHTSIVHVCYFSYKMLCIRIRHNKNNNSYIKYTQRTPTVLICNVCNRFFMI